MTWSLYSLHLLITTAHCLPVAHMQCVDSSVMSNSQLVHFAHHQSYHILKTELVVPAQATKTLLALCMSAMWILTCPKPQGFCTSSRHAWQHESPAKEQTPKRMSRALSKGECPNSHTHLKSDAGQWLLPHAALQAGLQTCSSHAGDVEVLFPLFLDPLKGKGIADLVALLRVPCALAHHHQ